MQYVCFECVFQMKSTGTHVEVFDVARRRSFVDMC